MTHPRYYARVTRNGTEDELSIYTPEGRRMLSVAFWDEDDIPASVQLKADTLRIVDALNSRATELLRAVLPYAREEAGMLGIIDDTSEEAKRAAEAVKAAREFLDSSEGR